MTDSPRGNLQELGEPGLKSRHCPDWKHGGNVGAGKDPEKRPLQQGEEAQEGRGQIAPPKAEPKNSGPWSRRRVRVRTPGFSSKLAARSTDGAGR